MQRRTTRALRSPLLCVRLNLRALVVVVVVCVCVGGGREGVVWPPRTHPPLSPSPRDSATRRSPARPLPSQATRRKKGSPTCLSLKSCWAKLRGLRTPLGCAGCQGRDQVVWHFLSKRHPVFLVQRRVLLLSLLLLFLLLLNGKNL